MISPNGASAIVKGDKFKYENPTVTGVSPSTGTKAGGTSVTVTGSGFALGAATSDQVRLERRHRGRMHLQHAPAS